MFFKKKPSTDKLTPEEWRWRLWQTGNTWELVDILVSEKQSFKKKVKVLLRMPKIAIQQRVPMQLLETKMEDCGHFQLAQIIRWQMFCALDSDEQQAIREWSQQAIEADFDARRII